MYDLVIRDGRIIDGTGKPGYIADIAIKNGIIEKIGRVNLASRKELHADGLVISPGIIDMHSHADLFLLKNPYSNHRILQGVTTEIVGNCGFSAAPVSPTTVSDYKEYAQPIMGEWPKEMEYASSAKYLRALDNASLRHNAGALVGCGALRVSVSGYESGALSTHQMDTLLRLLKSSLNDSALGASLGLMYVPETYFTTQELIQIASIIADFDRILTVHIRGEGSMLISSIDEMIDVAEKSGASVHISHLKAAGRDQWGTAIKTVIQKIEQARAKGIRITADVYPYAAGSTTLLSLLPPWAQEKGASQLANQLCDIEFRNKVAKDMDNVSDDWDNIVLNTGWDKVLISGVSNEKYDYLVGKDIEECAADEGVEPTHFVLKLISENVGAVSIVIHHMDAKDVDTVVSLSHTVIVSDSIYSDGGRPHPRMYGSFAKVLGDFVRKRGILTLEKAIQKCTSMPADCLKLGSRGRITECAIADLTIFDATKIDDKATYIKPRQYPIGITGVIVNGHLALWQEKMLHGSYGKVIRA